MDQLVRLVKQDLLVPLDPLDQKEPEVPTEKTEPQEMMERKVLQEHPVLLDSGESQECKVLKVK